MSDNHPIWSEEYRLQGREWAELEAAASLLEDSKSAVMAQKQTVYGDIPVNRAEQMVKASPEWASHIEKIILARKEANIAKIELEYIRMKAHEEQSMEANKRAEMRL
jgi:hypothetical protein